MRMSRAIVGAICGLGLASCSAGNSNLPNLNVPTIDLFDPPSTATLTIQSNPPGAEARPSSGGLCRTPCALPVPLNDGFTVTYSPIDKTRKKRAHRHDACPARSQPNNGRTPTGAAATTGTAAGQKAAAPVTQP